MTDHIIYQNSELYYYREGSGSKTILLFHGFGQDHRAYATWNEALKMGYTIYTFDLFFHGNSTWENRQALKMIDWKNILQLFFDQEKIGSFEIAGFSIGAKFVLATVELFLKRVNKIILLAPDGIKINFWYRLVTGTSMMRSLFRDVMLKPRRLHTLINLVKLFHLENKNLLRFVETQLSTEERRQRVYNSWIYFRHLKVNATDFSQLLNSNAIPVIFILGKSDKVIPSERIIGFAKTLNNHQFHITEAGHNDLIRIGINYIY